MNQFFTALDWYDGIAKTFENPPPEKIFVEQAISGAVMEAWGAICVAPTLVI